MTITSEETRSHGSFVFSLDTELAWGSVHRGGYANHDSEFERTRYVIDRLLEMFEQYGVKGTWAVVGKLMMDEGEQDPGVPVDAGHVAETERQINWRGPSDAHFWHGSDIVERIRACAVPQEIGCHNYTHMIMGQPNSDAEKFDAELKLCKAVADRRDIDLKSFVYPRNAVAHTDVLSRNGITSYRGVAPSWTWRMPGTLGKRVARLADHFLPVSAPVVKPSLEGDVVNVPASYSYLHRSGWARYVPIAVRVQKSIRSLRKASSRGGIFHLWTHPFNIASDPEGLLGGLERIFQEYRRLEESGLVKSATMSEIADSLIGGESVSRAS